MANNVDLMVVGAADGISAAELTERLMKEFGQPAEAFSELVAAACDGGAQYAAQTGVTLDTAVEGQGKLEDLGVVCQLIVDGEPLSSGGLGRNELGKSTAPESGGGHDLSVDNPADADNAVVAETSGESKGSEESADAGAEISLAPEVDTEFDEPSSDNAPADDSFDALEISFDDELDTLDTVPDASATDKSGEGDASAQSDDLADIAIDFDDEIESLAAIGVADQASVSSAPEATDAGLEQAEPGAEPASEVSVDVSAQEISDVSSPDDVQAETAADQPPASDVQGNQAGDSGELELSLAVEDDTPLTKPKQKSGVVPDDGGLTLVLDDTSTPAKKDTPVIASPTNIDEHAGSDDEHNDGVDELTVDASDDDATTPAPVSEGTADEIALRDTSREPAEVTPPVAAPDEAAPEPDQDEDAAQDNGAAQDNSAAKDESLETSNDTTAGDAPIADAQSASPTQGNDALAAGESTTESVEAPTGTSNDLSSFIDSMVTASDKPDNATANTDVAANDAAHNGGGLVLPGQTAAQPAEAPAAVADTPASVEPVSEEPATEDQSASIDLLVSAPAAAGDDDECYAPEVTASGGLTEEFLRQRKRKRMAMAAAGVGALGVGALVALQTGLLEKSTIQPEQTVAVVTTSDKTSELDAVAEVSLNAAIERSSALKNPDNYSTEELIAYLSEDLGENARKELKDFVSGEGTNKSDNQSVPRMGAAIPADSDSELWLLNRVEHPADKYFDEWSKREVDLQAYLELQERLIQGGDLDVALDVSVSTNDKLFAVMSQQRIARAFHARGATERAQKVLERAVRGTYSIKSEAERVMAIADYATTENAMGMLDDSADSFLKAQILARSMHKPATRTVAFSALAEYFHQVGRKAEAFDYLDQAMTTAYELPVNTAARDLAIRHVALTEVRLGMTKQATEHANLILDPFAAVSALHGIALELERTGDAQNARLTLNMAYRAGSLISDSDKRDKLLDKIKLSGN